MKNLILTLIILGLTACASTQNKPQLARMNATQAVTMPVVPKMTLDDVVKMSKDGATAEAIIAKLNMTSSSFDLTPSQALALSKQGVDIKVLDDIYKTHEQILQNQHADTINQQTKAKQIAEKKLAQERLNRLNSENWWVNRGWGYDPYFGDGFGFGGSRREFNSSIGYGFGW